MKIKLSRRISWTYRSLKFQSNLHLAIETEFYFTKGFFRVAFHQTFHKIEIPGQIFHGIAMNLIILLPQLVLRGKPTTIHFHFSDVHPIWFIFMLT